MRAILALNGLLIPRVLISDLLLETLETDYKIMVLLLQPVLNHYQVLQR